MKFPNTLAFRLTLWYLLAIVGSLIVSFAVFIFSVGEIMENKTDVEISEDVNELSRLYASEGMQEVQQEINDEIADEDSTRVFFVVLSPNGEPIYSSNMASWHELDLKKLASSAQDVDDEPVLQVLKLSSKREPVRTAISAMSPSHLMLIGETQQDTEGLMEVLLRALSSIMIVVIPLAALLGWFISRRAVHGINRVSRTAQSISAGHLDQRVSVGVQGVEVQRLAGAFNAMLDRIELLVAEMRDLTDNIAHDLRSPLARIRANAEAALGGDQTSEDRERLISGAIDDCDQLMHLINVTLDVAEADAGVSSHRLQSLDFSDLVTDVCELFEPAADLMGIKLVTDIKAHAFIKGDTDSLRRMIANLLDNALKYSTTDDRVDVQLSSSVTEVTLQVIDSGCGILAKDQQRIFDRFFRCDQSRTKDGNGLGLSYSQAIARSHGGEISVSSFPGEGATFSITLPKIIETTVKSNKTLPFGKVPITSG